MDGLELIGVEVLLVEGWVLNPDKKIVSAVTARLFHNLEAIGATFCPCSFEHDADHMCPCYDYRSGAGCHCHLYVPEED